MEESKFIPYGRQDVTEGDIEAVVKVLRSDFLTQGPAVPAFEQKLCVYTGAKYSIAVNSCTSALHIACLALDLGHGDILWTSPITFVASANCALYCGATVDFVDVEPDTALMSVKRLKEKLEWAEKEGKLPKIVVPVHFAGQPCDMKEIHDLGRQYGFKIIEDAAHAIGAKYQDESVGNCRYSDITVFSFHPVKIITTGEGGCALTNNKHLARKMTLYRSHGITRDSKEMIHASPEGWYYEQICLGFNYRMSDIQASLGISQLERLDQYVKRRFEIANWYDEKINLDILHPLARRNNRKSSHHLYVVQSKNKTERDTLYQHLIESDVYVNLHYIPVYHHPHYNININLPGAEQYFRTAISLPIFPTIEKKDLIYIMKNILEVCL